ncbi:MAG: transketolase, partial [Alphaproteobacteria bacterium]
GISLAAEGGAHQSVATPLIGIGQPGMVAFEPAFVDELAAVMAWSFEHMQAPEGGSVYLRLSTRRLEQPRRALTPELEKELIEGAYWLVPPAPGADLALVFTGAVAPEVQEAHRQIAQDLPGAGLLAVTSADRLHAGWRQGAGDEPSPAERLLGALAPDARLITVLDGHPASLSWLGSVRGQRVHALGVDRFGQSGDIPDLYRIYGIDTEAILEAVAEACLARLAPGV